MNHIKKTFLILIITILYVGASYASSEKWEKTYIESKEYGASVTLEIFENGLKQKNVGIVFPSDECDSYNSTLMNTASFYINNTQVQMSAQCISKGIRMDFPKTPAGRDYVINELKNESKVIYRQGELTVTFSANGFTKSYNSFESTSGGL